MLPIYENIINCTLLECGLADYAWNTYISIYNCIKYREEILMKEKF